MKLAFDKASVRSVDSEGIMHVSKTPISKANVCQYQGKEIDDSLEPEKWYNVYRDPEELAKAAHTFNNKPLLSTHEEFKTDAPPKDLIVGMTGDDAVFEYPYLYNSMTIIDAKQQAGIESDKHREISSSYRWTPVMKSGVSPEGEKYDIVMTNLSCNHVAIVPDGRAGSDVLVYDSKPTGYNVMSKLRTGIMGLLKGKLASDADPAELEGQIDNLVKDSEVDEPETTEEAKKPAEDEGDEKAARIAELEKELASLRGTAEDAEEKAEEMVKTACDSMRKEFKDLREAERICAPHVGNLACDSAPELYRATLKNAGIDASGVHASALKPMVEMLGKKSTLASDSKPVYTADSRDNAMRLINGGK